MIVEDKITSLRPEFSASKKALLEKRLRGARKNFTRPTVIPQRAPGGKAPLSFAQQRLWFFDQLEPASPLYNMPVALRLRGELNRAALRKSINSIVARHEALRTCFQSEDGDPAQVVAEPLPVELAVTDLLQCSEQLQSWLDEEIKRPFDLSRDPLLRATLACLGKTDHVLLVVMHHIVSDGWSLDVFFRELKLFYGALAEEREIALPELPIQYADFAAWQREWMRGEAMEKQLVFWKKHLAGAPPFLELPADRPRPLVQSFRGGHVERLLSKSLTEALKRLGQNEGTTLFMTLLAAFKILLHRYTGQTHLVVGSPIAGRNQIETEALIGFFVNTLALHTDLSGNPVFLELLARVRQTVFDGFAHQDLPFEKLVEELQLVRNTGYTPLVQVMFVLQTGARQKLKLPGLAVEPLIVGTGTSKFDLTFAVEEWPSGLLIEIEYSTDLFNEATIIRMFDHFQTLLEGIVSNPSQKIAELPLLADAEQNQILIEWNETKTNYPREKTIPQLFEEQVEKAPEAVAVVFGGQQLTYHELNERANQVTRHLQKLGIGTGALIAVSTERSLEMIVALLGILKAGGAYVSLEPLQPRERLALMLDNVHATVLLTQEKFRGHFQFINSDMKLLCLDTDWELIAQESAADLPSTTCNPESTAYVSFTSGSTGRPKGVVVPHRGVVRLVKETNYARFGADEIFLQLAPVSFDASTFEIWGALLNGAKLVVFPPGMPSLSELGNFIQKNKITTLWLTAGLFHQMVEEQIESLKNIRQLLAGGDVLSVPHVKRALEHLPGCILVNGYGPTENTTFTCCHEITLADCEGRSIPIGRPVANTQVYVLDNYLQPAPIGVPGELYAGGDGLALGYLNQPELTAEKFIANPFSDDQNAKLYKTGDLARWRPNGTIEFLGRIDSQVKVRGFRIELDEIEMALNEHPSVRDCAVKAWGERAGGKQLAAYFVANHSFAPSAEELRTHLRARLPDYMIPAVFMPLKSLPLNGNGKLDRKALPLPERSMDVTAKKTIAPRDELERQLIKIWEDVLEINHLGVEDHFFDLGGHSLLAVRLVARIEKVLGRSIPVAAIFQSPTIAQLAEVLRGKKNVNGASSIVEIQPKGSKPPLFFVHGVGGGMFWGYTNLSRHLGNDQPIMAFKSRGMDGQEEFATIEEMAAQYVADLRTYQPRGPFFLGGYCFGGNVAYEMARQLEAWGEKVALLVLINCAPPNAAYARFHFTPKSCFKFLKNLGYWAGYLGQLKPPQRREFFRWRLRAIRKRLLRFFQRSKMDVEEVVDLSAQPTERRKLWEAHIRALITHKTKPYSGCVTLFRTRGHPMFCSFDDAFGWREFANVVTVKIIPGAHESALEEPYAQALAKILGDDLHQIQTAIWQGNEP